MCFCASGIKKGNFYMIRLVASDIDGTLLQGGARALSDELFGLIRVLKKRGILFCAASGRQYRSMRALFAQAEDDIAYLCENGAIVYRGGSVVSKLAMERADALALIGQIQAQEQCEVLISGADTSYLLPKHPDYVDHIRYFVGNHITRVKRAQDIPEDILKVSAYCRDGEPYTDAGRAVESGVQRGCGGGKMAGFHARRQGHGPCCPVRGVGCAPAGGHSVR